MLLPSHLYKPPVPWAQKEQMGTGGGDPHLKRRLRLWGLRCTHIFLISAHPWHPGGVVHREPACKLVDSEEQG